MSGATMGTLYHCRRMYGDRFLIGVKPKVVVGLGVLSECPSLGVWSTKQSTKGLGKGYLNLLTLCGVHIGFAVLYLRRDESLDQGSCNVEPYPLNISLC